MEVHIIHNIVCVCVRGEGGGRGREEGGREGGEGGRREWENGAWKGVERGRDERGRGKEKEEGSSRNMMAV